MPELPEVETIKLGLQKYLVGHTIESVEVKLPRIVQGDIKTAEGAKITGVRRFGKGLVLDLNNGYLLAIHIKLTGQLIYVDSKHHQDKIKVIKGTYSTLPNKWTHVVFNLDKGAKLYYNDFRQFGWIKVVPEDELQKLVFFKELGPEFFPSTGSGQVKMTLEMFTDLVSKSKTVIKPLIMDQKKMSGLGNIYANDGLYLAKIDPRRKASSLSKEEVKTLYQSLETVLKKGLEEGGASELSFVNALGQEGNYQKHFLAYGQDGKKCKRCGGTFEKIMLGGRGTYFCAKCQK